MEKDPEGNGLEKEIQEEICQAEDDACDEEIYNCHNTAATNGELMSADTLIEMFRSTGWPTGSSQ